MGHHLLLFKPQFAAAAEHQFDYDRRAAHQRSVIIVLDGWGFAGASIAEPSVPDGETSFPWFSLPSLPLLFLNLAVSFQQNASIKSG